jgi:hypothetical protein
MTDKLDRHTDPSGLVASLNAATDGRPFLGDLVVVEGLLRQFASDVFTRYDEVGHGILTPNDASNADRAQCLKLAGIFCGQDPAYAPVREWTGAQLADHLRNRMERDLQPEDDDAKLVAQAMAVLVHRLYDVLRHANDDVPERELMDEAEGAVKSMAKALVGVVGND